MFDPYFYEQNKILNNYGKVQFRVVASDLFICVCTLKDTFSPCTYIFIILFSVRIGSNKCIVYTANKSFFTLKKWKGIFVIL